MKKWIVVVVVVLVAIDLVLAAALAIPRNPQVALVNWLPRSSECSLTEYRSELERESETPEPRERPKVERTEGGLDLWTTPQGPIWTVHGDTILPFLLTEQRREIYEPAGHEVHPGDIVLDCGANVGVFTRKALSRGASLVVSIEPSPQTLEALRRNFVDEIREGRVIVYPKGVWDHDGEMDLALDVENPGSNSLVLQGAGQRKVRVPLTTIDKVVAELKLPRVDFIKMDIEGAEKPALRGAENTIRRFRPRMSLSSEHLADDITAIPALVHSIEPTYTKRACDCQISKMHIKALVLAFDPKQ